MLIAFVDDSVHESRETVSLFLSGFEKCGVFVRNFDFFESGEAFLRDFEGHHYDLIILDIYMGEVSGIEVARSIRTKDSRVRIVFCSSSNDFANESYDVNASYYIRKPVTEAAVARMMARLDVADMELKKSVLLPDGQELVLRSMIFAEYSNHQMVIYTRSSVPMRTRLSFSAFVNLLSPFDFMVPCNSGSVVNLWEVAEMNDDFVVMSDASYLSVSRRKKRDFKEKYHRFLLNVVVRDDAHGKQV